MADRTEHLRAWVDISFKLIIAVVGVFVGYYFSVQRQQNEDIRLIVELSGSNQAEQRQLGAAIAQTYFDQRRIPEPIFLAIYSYANNGDDEALQAIVNTGVALAVRKNEGLQRAVEQANAALPVRIYFHIRDSEDRVAAAAIERQIETRSFGGQSIVVPGIEYIAGAQRQSELRCFRKAECESLGPGLRALFGEAGHAVELVDLSERYETSTSIRPNHFEVWFAPFNG